MATYVRGAGGHVAERIQAEPGSGDETRLDQLAADPASDWRRVEVVEEGAEDHSSAPSSATGKRPAKSAPVAAWVDWAVSHGMDRDQAEDLTKAELIELQGRLAADEEE